MASVQSSASHFHWTQQPGADAKMKSASQKAWKTRRAKKRKSAQPKSAKRKYTSSKRGLLTGYALDALSARTPSTIAEVADRAKLTQAQAARALTRLKRNGDATTVGFNRWVKVAKNRPIDRTISRLKEAFKADAEGETASPRMRARVIVNVDSGEGYHLEVREHDLDTWGQFIDLMTDGYAGVIINEVRVEVNRG